MTSPAQTALVPFLQPATAPLTADQQELYAAIHAAFEQARIPTFGGEGPVARVEVMVRSHRLWIDSALPLSFPPADLAAARMTLSRGEQYGAIEVVQIPNPKGPPGPSGPTEQDLLIVDVDGALLFTAALDQTDRDWRVVVVPWQGYVAHLIAMQAKKAQQHRLTRLEAGRLYLYARRHYEMQRAYNAKHHLPEPEVFPTLKTFGLRVGRREADMSLCVQMAEADPDLLDAVERGLVSEDQLRELASLTHAQQRAALGQLQQATIIGVDMGEQTLLPAAPPPVTPAEVPRATVRDIARQVKTGGRADGPSLPPPRGFGWAAPPDAQIDPLDLWVADAGMSIAPLPVQVVLGRLLHDVGVCLEHLPDTARGPVVHLLKKVISDAEVQQLIRDTGP